jgi:hypothetical protein
MNYRRIFFFAVFLMSISGYVTAQNKKEQILILSGKIDSLNAIVGKERDEHQLAKSKSQKEIMHLSNQLLLSKGQKDSLSSLLEKERAFSKDMQFRFQLETVKLEKQSNERDSLHRELKKLTAELKTKSDLTIKIDTLQLSEAEKYETCEALYFTGKDEMGEYIEISFYLGNSNEDVELGDNFFIENKDYDVYEGNEALVGKYYVVTFDTSDPYLFYDCGPLGDSERRQGEGRPASIGFQLLSVKKL